MEKRQLSIISVVIISMFFLLNFGFDAITGNVVGFVESEQEGYGGPSAEDSDCLYTCFVENNNTEDFCMVECGVEAQPEPLDESESCMQECIVVGCEEYDNECQLANVDSCDIECNMKGDTSDEGEVGAEELCILNCVNSVDPGVIC